MNGEDVICHPRHLWLVAVNEEFEFLRNGDRLSAAMSFSEDFVAAPAAMVRTAASRNQGNRAHSMVLPPNLHVPRHVDQFAGRPRLCVNILDLLAWLGAYDRTIRHLERNPVDCVQTVDSLRPERRHQLFQREFTFSNDDYISSCCQVFVNIGAGFRSSHNRLPAEFLGNTENLDYIRPRHQIRVDTKNGWRPLLQQIP